MKRFLILFLAVAIPIQWANTAMCGYCHLDLASPVSVHQLESVHAHDPEMPAAEVTNSTESTAPDLDAKCEVCKLASSVGPVSVQEALKTFAPQAGRPMGLSFSVSEADRQPPEFIPV